MELLPSFHFSTAFRNRFKTGEPGSRGSDAVSKAETVRAKMNSVPSGRHGIQPAGGMGVAKLIELQLI